MHIIETYDRCIQTRSILPRQIDIALAIPFSAATIEAPWTRSDGVCECTREGHGHQGRRSARLLWYLQGGELGAGWRACRKVS
jgi:hypothetical protein